MGDPRFFADIEGAAWNDVLRVKEERLLAQLAVQKVALTVREPEGPR